jgi:hypothetical protein
MWQIRSIWSLRFIFKDPFSFYHEKEMPTNNLLKVSTSEGCKLEGSVNIGVFPRLVKRLDKNFQGRARVNAR